VKVYENGSLKSTATFRAFAGKRGLGGVSLGVAVPEKYFTFVVPGGNHDGVKVAVGFLAPSTVPSYKPNLITTPERGKNAGTVSVWNMADICQCSTHEGHAMSGMAAMHDTTVQGPPMPVATFRPFGARRGAVNLATTYQRQLGGQAQAVVAAWQTPREVAFTAIGLDNQPQTVSQIRCQAPLFSDVG